MHSSYHNHTTWSDGASTLADMIEAARSAGMKELGISDHYALPPDKRRLSWAMAPESLNAYVAEVQQASAATRDLAIRLGLEVDYFPETIETVRQSLAPYTFDYLIASVHFVDGFPVDLVSQVWEELSQVTRDEIWRGYWRYLREAAESGLCDIVAHFDLPKKFKFYPSIDLTADALATLDIIAAKNMAIELNCAGWDKPVQEAYPSLFYLTEAQRRKIPLVINTDAHTSKDVIRNLDRAHKLAASAGYTELVRFERRKRIPYPL